MDNQYLVSIITPCYNSNEFISETIKSVQAQTYTNWEMLIVDDCSTDNSEQYIKEFVQRDSRIQFFKTDHPSGSPTLPRNIGIMHAKGRFIAFLDSDDLWLPLKLEEQIKLFEDKTIALVFSNYEKITVEGIRSNRKIVAPSFTSYKKMLKENVIGCLTAIYDVSKVGKMYFSEIKHEDYVMWLSILKKGFIAKNTNSIVALYRIQNNSLSSNKLKVFSWTWNIYRNVEHLNLIQSCYFFMHYAVRAGIKYLK